MFRDHIVCLAYRAQNWVLGDSEEIPRAGVVQPRSGVLSIVVGLTVRGAAYGLPTCAHNRFATSAGNRYAAHGHHQPRKLPRGHRYAVVSFAVFHSLRNTLMLA